VKPQFEVGREKVGKRGVVRDPRERAGAIFRVMAEATRLGWFYGGATRSPLTGPAGNVEYLLWLEQFSGRATPTLTEFEALAALG
jgi:23S rRNA (cytidine1920-2'-O)/16S rRNA (cytidine1409-2'-O)-methyltransferase